MTDPKTPTRDDLIRAAGRIWSRYDAPTEPTVECLVPPPPPSPRDALLAIRLQSELLGYLGDGKNMTFETLKRELEAMGFDLVPKRKLKAVPK